jgi:uncharacterized protein (TIGR01777 family)
MKIVITGGTGFIGSRLVEKLAADGHQLIVLSRTSRPASVQAGLGVQVRNWDAHSSGAWMEEVEGADAVLNFAGESIGAKRWTIAQKKRIRDSRLNATRILIEAIRRASTKPSVLVSASAVGYYGSVEHDEVSEAYQRGSGFLSSLCDDWEKEARAAEKLGLRVVMLRTGIVLGEDGGALAKMLLPFRMFIGGPIGTGRQWFPWVHRDDVVNIVRFALTNEKLSGPVNVAAPEIATMKQFCSALGNAIHRPSWAPVPSIVLKIALGEMSEMVLTGQRVVPVKLLSAGYNFLFPKLDRALSDIFS